VRRSFAAAQDDEAESSRVAERVVVCRTAELLPGERRIVVPFRGRAGIGVFNVNGRFHALRNICPHKSGPLCTGRVTGRIVAGAPPSGRPLASDDYRIVQEGEIIRCPWHLWEFEIATGRCLVDATARVKTYPVAIEDGYVVVYADPADLPPERPEASLDSRPPLL
jgi:nitrite reductase/ring-hydroxylating ferredoxin subunit